MEVLGVQEQKGVWTREIRPSSQTPAQKPNEALELLRIQPPLQDVNRWLLLEETRITNKSHQGLKAWIRNIKITIDKNTVMEKQHIHDELLLSNRHYRERMRTEWQSLSTRPQSNLQMFFPYQDPHPPG